MNILLISSFIIILGRLRASSGFCKNVLAHCIGNCIPDCVFSDERLGSGVFVSMDNFPGGTYSCQNCGNTSDLPVGNVSIQMAYRDAAAFNKITPGSWDK